MFNLTAIPDAAKVATDDEVIVFGQAPLLAECHIGVSKLDTEAEKAEYYSFLLGLFKSVSRSHRNDTRYRQPFQLNAMITFETF